MKTTVVTTTATSDPVAWIEGIPYYHLAGTPLATPLGVLVKRGRSRWPDRRFMASDVRLYVPGPCIVMAGTPVFDEWTDEPAMSGYPLFDLRTPPVIFNRDTVSADTGLFGFWLAHDSILTYGTFPEPDLVMPGLVVPHRQATAVDFVRWEDTLALWVRNMQRDGENAVLFGHAFGCGDPRPLLHQTATIEAGRIDAGLVAAGSGEE